MSSPESNRRRRAKAVQRRTAQSSNSQGAACPATARPPTSFSRSLDRSCDAPLDALLEGEDQASAIEVLRRASRELERRAAALEADTATKGGEERRRAPAASRGDAGRSSTPGSSPEDDAEKKDPDAAARAREDPIFVRHRKQRSLPTRSAPYVKTRRRNHHASMSDIAEESEQDTKTGSPAKNGCRFSVDQVARPHQMDQSPGGTERLIKIARLREGDGAWIRRSRGVWTYAALRARESGADPRLVFAVNARGATKSFAVAQWAAYVRTVAEDDAAADGEEDDMDLMLSAPDLGESRRTNGGGGRGDASASKKSCASTASGGSHSTLDALGIRDNSRRQVADYDISMYALGPDDELGESLPPPEEPIGSAPEHPTLETLGIRDNSRRPISDYEISMHALGLEDASDDSLPPPKTPASKRSVLAAANGSAPAGKKKDRRVSRNDPKDSSPTGPELSIRDGYDASAGTTLARPPFDEPRRERRALDPVMEEARGDTGPHGAVGPEAEVPAARKKKPGDVDAGRAIPTHRRHREHKSFYSALKSINKQ